MRVGVSHQEAHISRFFAPEPWERLGQEATVCILGSSKDADFHKRLAEADIDILLGSWGMPLLDQTLLDAAPRLRAVCYAAGTVKGFVTAESWKRGITITTAMHANAIPVAEVTVALIILANKNWFAVQDGIRRHGCEGYKAAYQDGHQGNYSNTVGLIGYGAIGREVLKLLAPYHLRVLVSDPYADADAVAAAGATLLPLEEVIAQSQVLSLHAPNIPATRHMINAQSLALMPDQATFINTARGALVDEDALVAELRRGRIQAMLDVTDPEPPEPGHPFYTLPNCWLTPHRAGSSGQEVRRMGTYAIEECLRICAGQEPLYPVTEDMLDTMA